ncbi:MAG: hypothetical protein ABIK83_01125 [Candidatus Zixiibacteriota bacterium]
MNRPQRIILIVYAVVISICCIYVPWDFQKIDEGSVVYIPLDYDFIWSKTVDSDEQNHYLFVKMIGDPVSISMERWAIQIVGLTLIAASLLAIFNDKKSLTA